ncbi:MAG: glycosyltransferase [Methanomicrobiales archaeon]|nr:glycosyltransferase [Methanomicrobiales archaeon]
MNKNNTTLVIFTASFPLAGAAIEPFLHQELPHLCAAFDTILLVPRLHRGGRMEPSGGLPASAGVDTSLVNCPGPIGNILRNLQVAGYALTSPHMYGEIGKCPALALHGVSVRRLLEQMGTAHRIRNWIVQQMERGRLDPSRTLFYTYWFDGTALGVSLARRRHPEIKHVTRAHGFDLYEERHNPPYMPFREEVLDAIDRVFLVSEHGKEYLSRKYPAFESKYTVSRLGVDDPRFSTEPSSDGVFRMVSCSHVVPIKRLGLLVQGLAELGRLRPEYTFEWVHIGDGPERAMVEKQAKSTLPNNVRPAFLGQIPPEEVMEYYRRHCIDLFLNVSESEGIPVTIMEAQSCGIPVLATAVGGTPEIVTKKVGLLLNPDPHPRDIAGAIGTFVDDPAGMERMRLQSRANWEENYNAEKNFKEFARQLEAIVS